MQTHHFTLDIDCNLSDGPGRGEELYADEGVIMLPDNYSPDGTPVRLVICCHGAGGTVAANDSQMEQQVLMQYLVANGFAIMDMNGLPAEYAEKHGIDLRNNVGSPIAVRSYVKAYHYCIDRFNLYPDVLMYGGSMGGISSANLVLSGEIPVIAHAAFCPVLDTYNEIFLHPWSDGLPKYALGEIYGFDRDAKGKFVYDEAKVRGFNPVNHPDAARYPVPVRFWQCEDDEVVSVEITRKFAERIAANGGNASLRTFPEGGHEPQLAGEIVNALSGNTRFGNSVLEIKPAVEEAFVWLKEQEARYLAER